MKPSELRIGNYVILDNIKGYFRVSCIYSDGIRSHIGSYHLCNTIKPITLTEARLEMLGFKFNGCGKFWVDKLCIHLNDNEFYILQEQGRVILTHIHQLQNLHFALTGKELVVKYPQEQ